MQLLDKEDPALYARLKKCPHYGVNDKKADAIATEVLNALFASADDKKMCYGYGFCEVPLVTTVVLLLIFALMPYMESTQKAEVSIYLEIDQLTAVNTVMGALHDTCPLMLNIEVTAPLSGDNRHVGIRLRTIGRNARKIKDPFALLTEIRKIEHVIYAVMD